MDSSQTGQKSQVVCPKVQFLVHCSSIVYVNDMPEVVHSSMQMFADDTKLYSMVNSPHEAVSLQADLEAMARWSDTWQLPFNEAKCKVLHLGRSNPNLQYMMRDTELRTVQVERDLGVHIDCDLKFRQHAATVVAKATQVLAVIRFVYLCI